AGGAGERWAGAAWALSSRRDGDGVVRADAALADPRSHAGPPASGDRARHDSGLPPVPVPVAARPARSPAPRGGGAGGDRRPAPGLPGGRLILGERPARLSRRPVRPGAARPALLLGGDRLGAAGLRGRLAAARTAGPRDAHRRGPARGPSLAARRDPGRVRAAGGSGAAPAGAARAARCALSPRASRADRPLRARAERGALGAGLRRPRHVGRIRRAARSARGQDARRIGPMVTPARVRGGTARAGVAGQARAAVSAPVRDRLPRSARSRAALSALAGSSPDLPADGGARRDPWWPVRASLLGGAVRAAGSGGRGARGAEASQGRRRARQPERLRSAEPRRRADTGSSRPRAAAESGGVRRRRAGGR